MTDVTDVSDLSNDSDLSTNEPVNERPWPSSEAVATNPNGRRCAAHKKNGEQCRRHARRGTTVCDWHGAKAPQVKAKARQRLEEATDRMAKELLGMATDPNVADAVKLAALKDVLDRGGVSAKTSVEVGIRPLKAYEEIMDGGSVQSGSRAEYRRSIGIEEPEPEQIALPTNDDDLIIDADVMDDYLVPNVIDDDQAVMPENLEHGSVFDTAPSTPHSAMMPLIDAVHAQRAIMRRTTR